MKLLRETVRSLLLEAQFEIPGYEESRTFINLQMLQDLASMPNWSLVETKPYLYDNPMSTVFQTVYNYSDPSGCTMEVKIEARFRSQPWEPGTYLHLSSIEVLDSSCGKSGVGGRCMRELLNLADSNGVILMLVPYAFNHDESKMTTYQLTRWYGRLGFKTHPWDYSAMYREPLQ